MKNSDALETPVSPRDCTLLVAIPLDRETFLADLTRQDKDFAKTYADETPNLNDLALWERYEPYAEITRYVCASVRRRGVTVVERATFADFCAALSSNQKVITLVAHWRSARFRAEDIQCPDQVREYLGNIAAAAGLDVSSLFSDIRNRKKLADTLNLLLDWPNDKFENALPDSSGESAGRQYKWHTARLALEHRLGAAVKGGASVEFYEGFKTITDILAGFSPDFTGLLDLSVCQSVLLGEEVKRRYRNCMVTVFAINTRLDVRLAMYEALIELLARAPQPFETALFKMY